MPAPRLAALAAAGLLAGGLALASADDGPAPARAPDSRLLTLYAGDPVTHALDLADGSFGGAITGTRFDERRAHLDYGNYRDDALTVALEEDDRGVLLDLGHWADLAKALDFEEAIGGGVGFASLSFAEDEIKIARRLPRDSFQNLREARPILSTAPGERHANLAPVPGHIYLARVQDRFRKSAPVYAKLLVVSHVPGDHVTLRWSHVPGL
jgi:hypothetical protein